MKQAGERCWGGEQRGRKRRAEEGKRIKQTISKGWLEVQIGHKEKKR